MILRHPNDAIVSGTSPKQKFFVAYADVTETVHAVSDLHNCSPGSERVLAQAFCAAALMGAHLSRPREALAVQTDLAGPAAGTYVEHSFGGAFRGYVRRRNLPEEGGTDPKAAEAALLGGTMDVRTFWTNPRGPDAKAVLRVEPASFQNLVDQFFLRVFHLPTLSRIDLRLDEQGVERAQALMLQCRLDGDMEGFIRRQADFDDGGAVGEIFDDPVLETVREVLDIEDLGIVRRDPVAFRCGCSRESALASLAAQPPARLQALAAAEGPQTVACQFCGQAQTFSPEDIRAALAKRTKES